MNEGMKKIIATTFLELSDALETGKMGRRPKIIITGMSSEHGEEEVLAGALAAGQDVEVVYIGSLRCEQIRCICVDSADQAMAAMNDMLDSGEADGAVTMHYPFPIGVATVGRVLAPARGKPVYIATTTGTSSVDRVESMVKNTVYGIIAAKACGNPAPTVGIANLDGARQTETLLKKLVDSGYPLHFAQSERADGGCILRGNDILTGTADVIVTDTLTGNLMMKLLTAYNTGGNYESTGWGYGPGIGQGYDRLVLIASRASGAPVIAGALNYAAELVRGGWKDVAAKEFAVAEKAGFGKLSAQRNTVPHKEEAAVAPPPKVVVTGEISGVDVMDIDNAVCALWKSDIYAEGGMGCTGPVVLVAEDLVGKAELALQKAGYLAE